VGALIFLSFLLPLAVSVLLLIAPIRAAVLRLAPVTPLPALALALLAPLGTEVDVPWLLLGSSFGIDQTGRSFLLFTSFVWLVSGWYARGYLHNDPRRSRFWMFFLATQAGNFGLCVAQDAASFYLLFALMTFAAYGLVVHKATADAIRAGRVYLIMALLGEAALIAGILMAVYAGNSLLLAALAMAPTTGLAVALLLVGFGIKAGLPLLHLWLPLAHPVAPVPASAVLSGVMIKAGVLGWLRFLPLGEAAMPEAGGILMLVAVLAMFYGVAVGLTQSDVKVLLAYSSISQMGFITLGVGAGLAQPGLWPLLLPAVTLYAMHHALGKSALFLGSGVAKTRPGNRLVLAALALPALALAGATFTSGALVKTGLKYALADMPGPWPAALNWALPLAAMGTSLLLTRFLILAAERSTEEKHPNLVLPWVILLLSVATSAWWLAPVDAVEHVLRPDALLASTWPVVAGIFLGLAFRRSAWTAPSIPPGDVLVLLERLFSRVRRATFGVPHLRERASAGENLRDRLS
jgi:formate hydrogenlyase subunit 3/multisubunit Na+/H+ antiporter MnhD subunit